MRRIIRAFAIVLCIPLLGCGSKKSDSGGAVVPPPPVPLFRCDDSQPQPDQVVLMCGVKISSDVWEIDVMIGAHADADIGGFAFDLLINPAVLTYVPASAKSGSLLFQGGASPLLSAATLAGDPVRLVVGIYRTSGAPGVAVVPGTFDRIMAFRVKAVPGAQFDGDPANLRFDGQSSAALDASVSHQAIPSIKFSDQLLLSRQ